MLSPWPPSTNAVTSSTETSNSCARNRRKRALSSTPAMPTTFSGRRPELAVAQLAAEKGKIALISAGGTTDITGKGCTPNAIQWVYNTYAVANAASLGVTEKDDTWYFI